MTRKPHVEKGMLLKRGISEENRQVQSEARAWRQQPEVSGADAGILAGDPEKCRTARQLLHADASTALEGTLRGSGQAWAARIQCRLWPREGTWTGHEYARSNTKAEQTHILAAIIKLLEVKFRCCTQLTTTGAIDNFNDCGQWTANQMEDARIFDMKSKFKEAGLKFTIKVTQDTS